MGFTSAIIPNTLSAIRVGYTVYSKFIIIPTTTYSRALLIKLAECGVIKSIERYNHGNKNLMLYKITLDYINMRPCVNSIKLLSKSSRNFFIKWSTLRQFSVTRGGILILSTSCGILTDREAVTAHVGGKLLAWIEI